MSATIASLYRCCQRSTRLFVFRRQRSSSTASPPSLYKRMLLFLTQQFYDVERLLHWRLQQSSRKLQRKNAYFGYTHKHHGPDIASAYFVLSMRGGFRYVGHSEWYRANQKGKFNWGFLEYKNTKLEEVDMSHTAINFRGLENLEQQKTLRTLKLRGCTEVDDWFLTRLYVFEDTLEELDISHCPRITTGGLPALGNLRGLKRLDVSSLPGISNPGLVIILLEEMLPQCEITATGYDHSLKQAAGQEEEEEKEDLRQRQS